jgi:hypothetical protein
VIRGQGGLCDTHRIDAYAWQIKDRRTWRSHDAVCMNGTWMVSSK